MYDIYIYTYIYIYICDHYYDMYVCMYIHMYIHHDLGEGDGMGRDGRNVHAVLDATEVRDLWVLGNTGNEAGCPGEGPGRTLKSLIAPS